MPDFDLRKYAAMQSVWNPGGPSYVVQTTTPKLQTTTQQATRELLGSVSDAVFGPRTYELTDHSIGTTISGSAKANADVVSLNVGIWYQIPDFEVYETIVSDSLTVTDISARGDNGRLYTASYTGYDISESGYIGVVFAVSSVSAGVTVTVTATLSGTVRTKWFSGGGKGEVHFAPQTSEETTYAHTLYSWTNGSGTYTDTSSYMGYQITISATSTSVSGNDGTVAVTLVTRTREDKDPSSIGCVLTLTGTATVSQYLSSGTYSVSGYTGISNISPRDAQITTSYDDPTLTWTCTVPYDTGETRVSFRINYEASGYYTYYYYWKIKINNNSLGSIGSSAARYIYINDKRLDAYDYYRG